MTTLPGQYQGWHHSCYAADRFVCLGVVDDCCNSPGSRPTNYYACKPCNNKAWFESKITTFMSEDVTRAESQQRLNSPDPLPVHSGTLKLFKEFRKRGGVIRVLGRPEDMPNVTWCESKRVIKSAVWPPHLRRDQLYGCRRAVAQATDLSIILENPFDEGHEALKEK